MKRSAFKQLAPRQQHVMVVAMYLRNALEDFHGANLDDQQMKELNQLIRSALFEIVSIIEDEADAGNNRTLLYLVDMIPDYWEVPEEAA